MQKNSKSSGKFDNKSAAVCGLFCEACTLFIATTEDLVRLKGFAARFQLFTESIKCYGCRSAQKSPYCEKCTMFSCAAKRGIDFCIECEDYPCSDLKQFQSKNPQRLELWDDLEQIKIMGYDFWLNSIRNNYTCPRCLSLNSAYDLKCRKCGLEPSCEYVRKHKLIIEQTLKNI